MAPNPDYLRTLDPELRNAAASAQSTFKHFWYQVATDFNRIVPALEIACLKAPFFDDIDDPQSSAEHMWLDDVYFDGAEISGTLINSPQGLSAVKEGDRLTLTLDRIEDWICALDDQAYGGFSVQVLRSRMNSKERREHDRAWGLKFPEPDEVYLPQPNAEFEKEVLVQQLVDQVNDDPDCLTVDYGEGRRLLHMMSLFGRAASVSALLSAGADRNQKCDRGWSPLDYAQAVGWHDVAEVLEAHRNPMR